MNMIGGFMYSYTKYQEGKKNTFHKDENSNKVAVSGGPSFPVDKPRIVTNVTREEHSLSEIKVS